MISETVRRLRDRRFRRLTKAMEIHDDEIAEMIAAGYAPHIHEFEGLTYVVFRRDGHKIAREIAPGEAHFYVREFIRRQEQMRNEESK